MSNEAKNTPYPGIPTTGDGAAGVVWVETNITHGACAYPITSSTTMGTASRINVYHNGSAFEIENGFATSRTVSWVVIGY